MSPRRQILKLKLAAMLGLNSSFDADCYTPPAFEYASGNPQFSFTLLRLSRGGIIFEGQLKTSCAGPPGTCSRSSWLSATALEELRLLSCANLDKVPFSLVLVGDNGLAVASETGRPGFLKTL
jgi:hypothetical protein